MFCVAAAGAAEYERAVWMVLREQQGIAVRSKARSATWPCAPPANVRSEHPLGWGQMEIDEARALEPEELGVLVPGAAEYERGRVGMRGREWREICVLRRTLGQRLRAQ